MDAIIHYIKRGRSFGPVSVADFLDLVDTQVLAPDDLVRLDGETSWLAASALAERLRSGRLVIPVGRHSNRPKPSSVMPPGGHTVFTSAPPIPKAPVPRELRQATPTPGCRACGAAAGPEARFCKLCGASLAPQRCGACKHDNDADARFCERCGHKLSPPPQP